MKATVTIREYARLTTAEVEPTLDVAQLSQSAFDWLCELSASFSRNGATLLQVDGRHALKWDSYVGVVETPCGTRLEILPKHHEQDDQPADGIAWPGLCHGAPAIGGDAAGARLCRRGGE